jgi:hypothetical protein
MQLNLHTQNRCTEHHPHFSRRKYSRHALSDDFGLGYRHKIIEEGRGQFGCVSSQEVTKIIKCYHSAYRGWKGGECVRGDQGGRARTDFSLAWLEAA